MEKNVDEWWNHFKSLIVNKNTGYEVDEFKSAFFCGFACNLKAVQELIRNDRGSFINYIVDNSKIIERHSAS